MGTQPRSLPHQGLGMVSLEQPGHFPEAELPDPCSPALLAQAPGHATLGGGLPDPAQPGPPRGPVLWRDSEDLPQPASSAHSPTRAPRGVGVPAGRGRLGEGGWGADQLESKLPLRSLPRRTPAERSAPPPLSQCFSIRGTKLSN